MKKKTPKTDANKLTLSVDKALVEKVKQYTLSEQESISGIVSDFLETYIAMKSKNTAPNHEIASHAAKFAGIISLKNSASHKDTIADTIISKHQKRFK